MLKVKHLELLIWLPRLLSIKKPQRLKKNISDKTGFITTSDFNRLTKISFDVRMKKKSKSLASKIEVHNALSIADKKWEKIKTLKRFDSSYFIGRRYFADYGSYNYLVF